MRYRTCKIEDSVWRKLKGLNTDMNKAIRNLFESIRNEGERIYSEECIDRNKEIYDNNMKEMQDLPKQKEEYKEKLRKQLNRKLEHYKIQETCYAMKLKYPQVITATREYETKEDWIGMEKKDAESALLEIKENIKSIQEALQNMDETIEAENPFTQKEEILKSQNVRIEKENARHQEVLKRYEELGFEELKGEQNYIS
tara:strand:- start:1385 stop:1981 length:597 start_codon:yes stop_codon:yes gene_type:complete